MNFDYFSCIQDKVIVDDKNKGDHKNCDIVGEFFKIKVQKKKLYAGVISRSLINKAKEEQNIERFHKREKINEHKKLLAQERFEKQIKNGEIIVNLLEMKI